MDARPCGLDRWVDSLLDGSGDAPSPEGLSAAERELLPQLQEIGRVLRAFESLHELAGVEDEADDDAVASPQTTPASAPPRLGDFVLGSCLGEGPVGVVYRARRVDGEGPPLALKLIRREVELQSAMERWRTLCRARSTPADPTVAHYRELGCSPEGRLYLVSEYIPGPSLDRWAVAHPLLEERLRFFRLLCSALARLHARGLIHGRLSPSNVRVVTGDGAVRPCLLDLELASILGPPAGLRAQPTTFCRPSQPPRYAPPEEALGAALAPTLAGDLFALGVMLTELVTGAPPMKRTLIDPTAPGYPLRWADEPLPWRDALPGPASLRARLESCLSAALAPEPHMRLRDAGTLADTLARGDGAPR